MNSSPRRTIRLFGCSRIRAGAITTTGASTVKAAPLRVAYSAISGAMALLWVAQEGGYFKREGLDVELLYIGGGSLLKNFAPTYPLRLAQRTQARACSGLSIAPPSQMSPITA